MKKRARVTQSFCGPPSLPHLDTTLLTFLTHWLTDVGICPDDHAHAHGVQQGEVLF